jgi:hypothetical protein
MIVTSDTALSSLPAGLRTPLLHEFNQIIGNYMEHRWASSELSGGRFCEIVYTILEGHARGLFAASPFKPNDFVSACRSLEGYSHVPRSFQILIPRLLPGLYEIRNNRNVGHVGGDVNPDFMDSSAVVSISSWILAELVRVFHGLSTGEAQALVDNLCERRIPLVWKSGDLRRVLKPRMPLKDQVLLLIGSVNGKVSVSQLLRWTGCTKVKYFYDVIRKLSGLRLVEHYADSKEVELLPPGADYVSRLIAGEAKKQKGVQAV